MRMRTVLLIWTLGMGLVCCGKAAAAERLPLLDGGFWQPNSAIIDRFSNEQLAREVRHFKQLGMDLIIFQYAGVWDEAGQTYRAYLPNDAIPMAAGYGEKDPLGAILDAAEREGVKVILGGLLMPPSSRYERWEESIAAWTSDQAMAYRRQLLERYASRPCVVGYYLPVEYNPEALDAHDADPALAIQATQKITRLIREVRPEMTIIHPIGLYLQRYPDYVGQVSIQRLDSFWRPWIAQLDQVDAWMVIDGVGTHLSNLQHTDQAQAWCAQISHEHGKEYWADVENAVMGAKGHYPFTMDRFARSLEVAARHADRIVTFDYLHYMSRESYKPDARALHEAYQQWRQDTLSSRNQ